MWRGLLTVLAATLAAAQDDGGYDDVWATGGGSSARGDPSSAGLGTGAATCVDIPRNFSLCAGIGYRKMRLPNLLGHESLAEVAQQAGAWMPLLALECHPDTRLFLCSLFSPVCLDRAIPPCRSLCEAVRAGCEARMEVYGYPWPDMVRCDRFPRDNDMCIALQHSSQQGSSCMVCKQPDTFENLVDNYCRADFVIKTRIKRLQKSKLSCKKPKILKVSQAGLKKDLKRPTFKQANLTSCCGGVLTKAGRKGVLMIMGSKTGDGDLQPNLIVAWQKAPKFRSAIRMMRKLDCTDPKKISEAMLSDGLLPFSPEKKEANRRKSHKNKRDRKLRGAASGNAADGEQSKVLS